MSSSTSLATSSSGWSPVSGGPWRWRRRLGDELGEKPEAAHRLPELPGGYLYPVLAWGEQAEADVAADGAGPGGGGRAERERREARLCRWGWGRWREGGPGYCVAAV